MAVKAITATKTAVKTGDTAPLGLWSALMAGSFGVFEILRRRNKKCQ